MSPDKWFTEHPASVGETYTQHMRNALCFSLRMLVGGLACFVHAFLPFLFVKTGSHCISELHERMVTHRSTAHRFTPGAERAATR